MNKPFFYQNHSAKQPSKLLKQETHGLENKIPQTITYSLPFLTNLLMNPEKSGLPQLCITSNCYSHVKKNMNFFHEFPDYNVEKSRLDGLLMLSLIHI